MADGPVQGAGVEVAHGVEPAFEEDVEAAVALLARLARNHFV